MPRFGDDLVNDRHPGVDPDNGQVKVDEEHVDGSVEAGITLFDQKQALVTREAGAEHQPAQAAEK